MDPFTLPPRRWRPTTRVAATRSMLRRLLCVSLAVLPLGGCEKRPAFEALRDVSMIDSTARALMQREHVQGLALAVIDSGQVLASAEIYDPVTGTFRRNGNMTMIRHKHAAAVLRDGKVLIIGGSDARDGRGRYASAEVFDPTTGTFAAVHAMNAERFKFTYAVVVLRTGEVLVAGGAERAEVYNPATNRFRNSAGSVGADLSFSTATLLRDGRVLIAGGYDSRIQPTAGAWLYRPRQ